MSKSARRSLSALAVACAMVSTTAATCQNDPTPTPTASNSAGGSAVPQPTSTGNECDEGGISCDDYPSPDRIPLSHFYRWEYGKGIVLGAGWLMFDTFCHNNDPHIPVQLNYKALPLEPSTGTISAESPGREDFLARATVVLPKDPKDAPTLKANGGLMKWATDRLKGCAAPGAKVKILISTPESIAAEITMPNDGGGTPSEDGPTLTLHEYMVAPGGDKISELSYWNAPRPGHSVKVEWGDGSSGNAHFDQDLLSMLRVVLCTHQGC